MGDPKITALQIKRLGKSTNILAIIGPILSENVVIAATIADMYQIPLITPTATETGIAAIGENIFQLNPDLAYRGEAMANFAVDSLGLEKFAILSPADSYGKQLSDAFTSTVDRLGGRVVAQQWYYDVPEDLGEQFKRIRKAAWKIKEQEEMKKDEIISAQDTDYVEIDTMKLDRPFRFEELTVPEIEDESLLQEKEEEITMSSEDSLKVPLNTIDALYLPIHTEYIPYIAPQFAFYNLQTQLLGNDDWYDKGQIQEHSSYIQNLIFATDYYMDSNSKSFLEFSSRFEEATGRSLTRISIYGYETMKYILKTINSGYVSRELLRKNLANSAPFKGVIRDIYFQNEKSRVNSAMFLIQVSKSRLKVIHRGGL
jgi:ABC-type branched-subunit amino acid transport system substrate-binding protein